MVDERFMAVIRSVVDGSFLRTFSKLKWVVCGGQGHSTLANL